MTLKLIENVYTKENFFFQVLENLLESYNKDSTGLALINLHPDILKTLKSVTETKLLHQVCKSSDELHEITFGSNPVQEEERPLLNDGKATERRKSSARSNKFLENKERKLSVYDLE